MPVKKVLIIRFSSIGDIVLCSPVIRSLKQADLSYQIHFLTKPTNLPLLKHNPHLDKIHLLSDSFSETLKELKAEGFNYILDLHNNLRSFRIKAALRIPVKSFPKKNFAKYQMVRFKNRSIRLEHVVQRYGKTLDLLNIKLDDGGLDFFLPKVIEEKAEKLLAEKAEYLKKKPLAVVLGAKHATKRWIPEHFVSLLNGLSEPVMLIGGPDAEEEAAQIENELSIPTWNTVGQFSLLDSAALMKNCTAVISHDTGFMHIAAAFKMKIYSLWGNTVPAFGMYPYKTEYVLIEKQGLSCRPCSKIGFDSCPKGHFDCMRGLSPEEVGKYFEEN